MSAKFLSPASRAGVANQLDTEDAVRLEALVRAPDQKGSGGVPYRNGGTVWGLIPVRKASTFGRGAMAQDEPRL
jgi:hypothetical protein